MAIPPVPKELCYPQREGNTAIPYIDGEESMKRIFEVISGAESQVWMTMCFVDVNFKIPSFDKSIIEIISEVSQKEGIDFRVLAWRSKVSSGDFGGTKDDFELLEKHNCKAKIRWDVNKFGCHHQKIFIIDDKTAFIGGVNMDETHIDNSAHNRDEPPPRHDLFCEIMGPAVRDVKHNFVQRWNEATEKDKEDGSYPKDPKPEKLDFPSEQPHQVSEGKLKIQVTRTIPRDVYDSIKDGEFSIRESYLNAINNAKRYVYLENQYFFDTDSHYSVIRALVYAAYRGVKIFIIIPGNPDFTKLLSFDFLREVKNHPNIYVYTLATSKKGNGKGKAKYNYKDVYIHAKLFIVDDAWYSIGSANISVQSLRTDSEINVTVWDREGAKALRKQLWQEHLEYSEENKSKYSQKIIDDKIKQAFEQWWFFARANNYYRMTHERAEARIMPLDLRKYTLLKKKIGDIKDLYKKSKKGLSDKIRKIIEKFRKHT